MKKWLIGVLGAIVGSLVVAWITGVWSPSQTIVNIFQGGQENNEQFELAKELSRKYYFFSNGNEPWSSPHTPGFPNQFRKAGNVIYDDATGLTWQKRGSQDSIGYPEISGFLRKLNTEKFEGHEDWRLPSLAEAWTLLDYQKNQAGLHIDSAFDSEQKWIWTTTMTSDGYGWFVFFEYGKPIFQNAWQSHAYVRAVRGPEFK